MISSAKLDHVLVHLTQYARMILPRVSESCVPAGDASDSNVSGYKLLAMQ